MTDATVDLAEHRGLLELEDVSVTYASSSGPVPAVRSVTLSLDRGQIMGVAGESGCGKSTLASTVLRLQPDSAEVSGRILVAGKDVLTMRWGDLRALRWAGASMIFQGALHSLNPVHKVGDQIAEAILVHEPDLARSTVDERIRDLMGQVGLPPERARSYPHQLSGGQRQRIMIAMALACDPDLIIADEPTTALDVMVQAQILDKLAELVTGRDLGVLIISHDLSVLADLCDVITVMYAGRVVEQGSADQVFSAPLHPYARALAAAFPRVGDPAARFAPSGLPGDPPDPADLPPGCAFAPRCSLALPACRDSVPPLVEHAPGRSAACFRIGESA